MPLGSQVAVEFVVVCFRQSQAMLSPQKPQFPLELLSLKKCFSCGLLMVFPLHHALSLSLSLSLFLSLSLCVYVCLYALVVLCAGYCVVHTFSLLDLKMAHFTSSHSVGNKSTHSTRSIAGVPACAAHAHAHTCTCTLGMQLLAHTHTDTYTDINTCCWSGTLLWQFLTIAT